MSTKILVFTATWCNPCKALKPILETVSKSYPDTEFQYIDLDSEQGERLADEYRVRSVPTVIAADTDANILISMQGAQTQVNVETFFKSALGEPAEVIDHDGLWELLHKTLPGFPTAVLFEKANGTMREMVCTKNEDLFDYEFKKTDTESDEVKPDPVTLDSVTVWDLEAKGWRKLTKGKLHEVKALSLTEVKL